ncbi:MAG: TPR end-of-group domain-containing protein [Planctomycetota bacterium]
MLPIARFVFVWIQAASGGDATAITIQDLASPDPQLRAKYYERVKLKGRASIREVFDTFAEAPAIAREIAAKLLREAGTVEEIDLVEKNMTDSHPLVRLEFANFAGRPDFAITQIERRTAVLLKFARDPEFHVREAALKWIGRAPHRCATEELLALVRDGDSYQKSRALTALAAAPDSAAALLSLSNWISDISPADRALWLQCLGFTTEISVFPTLLRYGKHPADGAAAASGFDILAQRLLFRRKDAEYLQVLDGWSAIDPVDCAWRRAKFELLTRADLGAAREAARALDAAAAREDAKKREWRAIAHAIAGICDITDNRPESAEENLNIAFDFVEGRRAAGADDAEDEMLLMLGARVRVLSAFNIIINRYKDGPNARDRISDAYDLFEQRVFQSTVRSLQGLWVKTNQDDRQRMAVLNRIFSGQPWDLSANWNFDPALETEIGALSVISTILPKRGRGAEGLAAGVEILNILSDINAHEFVTALHASDWMNTPDPFGNINVGRVPALPVSPVRVRISIPISTFTRDLGQVARMSLGDLTTAAELLEPVIERASTGTSTADLISFVDACLERAGVSMDAHEPDTAEKYIQRALSRLDQVKKSHEEEFDKETVKLLGTPSAEARTAQAKIWLELERRMRAQTLISRAVNENVVKGKPDVAARFAKEGVALDPTEFNKVVLACYLAREGTAAEARAILRDATDSPGTYYNLSCTYALLGDPDTALYYLERDFQEHSDRGGLERQRAWARKDPDLKSLRDDPRFIAIVAPEAAASRPAKPVR